MERKIQPGTVDCKGFCSIREVVQYSSKMFILFITLPLFYKIAYNKSKYGQYTIYSSWSGILIIFLTLNLAYEFFSNCNGKI